MVTVAADRLLQATPEALEEDGQSDQAQRIDELMRVLGSKFPVYVLVTKCDLVQGMTQFCGQLDDELLQQAFGAINHELSQDYPAFHCAGHVRHHRRAAHRTLRLLMFHKLETRALDPALLLFPEEFSRLKTGLRGLHEGGLPCEPIPGNPHAPRHLFQQRPPGEALRIRIS
ncbi:MAG: type VI secretion system protein [Desulfobacterales bacterium]|nr:type VI secretion system protein [Desulfobacterales bacterium]